MSPKNRSPKNLCVCVRGLFMCTCICEKNDCGGMSFSSCLMQSYGGTQTVSLTKTRREHGNCTGDCSCWLTADERRKDLRLKKYLCIWRTRQKKELPDLSIIAVLNSYVMYNIMQPTMFVARTRATRACQDALAHPYNGLWAMTRTIELGAEYWLARCFSSSHSGFMVIRSSVCLKLKCY